MIDVMNCDRDEDEIDDGAIPRISPAALAAHRPEARDYELSFEMPNHVVVTVISRCTLEESRQIGSEVIEMARRLGVAIT